MTAHDSERVTADGDGPVRFPFEDDTGMQLGARYDEVRARPGLTRVRLPYGGDAWLATRMEDVRSVLSDSRFNRSVTIDQVVPRYTPEVMAGNNIVVAMDAPDHTRVRRLITKALSNRLIDSLRPWVRETVRSILTSMVEQGPPVDLVSELSEKLPRLAICRLLGMPYEDRERFDPWVDAVFAMAIVTREEVGRASSNISAYLAELVELRRAEPMDDLITALINVRNGDDRLTTAEIVANATGILVAGFETTATMITNIVHILATHPTLRSTLVADPGRVPDAVEEMLRYVPLTPSSAMNQYATEDVTIDGTLVRKGEFIIPCLVSANYDESVFHDPRTVDVDREMKGRHLAFGYGPHFCVGARLARIELQEVLSHVLELLPTIRLAVPEGRLPRKPWPGNRGFSCLPVTW